VPVVVATVNPKPGKLEEVAAIFSEIIPDVHGEPGCELYSLHRNADTLVMIEKWSDADALATHSKGPALASLGPRLAELVEGAPNVVVLEALPAGDATKGAL
jgi:quinol monooxygenase YgiN